MNSTIRSVLISTVLLTGLAGAIAPAFAQEQQEQSEQSTEEQKPASGGGGE